MNLTLGRSHLVQRPQTTEQASRTRSDGQQNSSSPTTESSNVQQSIYASVTQVAAFSTAQTRQQDQDQQTKRAPRLVQPRNMPASSIVRGGGGATPSAASKKKLLSMAMQAQKQRREASLAASILAGSTSPSRQGLNTSGSKGTLAIRSRDEASSSDADSSPQRGSPAVENSSDCNDQAQSSFSSDSASLEPQNTNLSKTGEPSLAVAQGLGVLRPRKMSGGAYPKTLTLSDSEPLSLVPPASESDETKSFNQPNSAGFLDSPVKLMPPSDPERIHSLQGSIDDETSAPVDCEQVIGVTDLNDDVADSQVTCEESVELCVGDEDHDDNDEVQ